MKVIKHNGICYATIGDISEAKKGWSFCDDVDSPLQWGTGVFYQGDRLLPHFHRSRARIKYHKTQEFIYVAQGTVVIEFYDANKNLFRSETLSAGGYVYFDDGIHGIRVLEHSILIEIKNGPFSGNDKERI